MTTTAVQHAMRRMSMLAAPDMRDRELMNHHRAVLMLAVIGLLFAACSSSRPVSSVTPPSPSANPSVTPSVAPTGGPTSPEVSQRPSDAPPSTRPTPSPAPAFSAAERRLIEALRADSRIDCAPRRADLPQDANAGVECHIGSALVDRVGIYGFGPQVDVDPALAAYLERLAANDVAPRSGDCKAGTAGDSSWPDYLPDTADDGTAGYSALRSGCFLDENGTANVRLTCYGPYYIGILGKTADIAGLYAWAWRIADGESTHRDPPGICAAPD